MKRLIGLICLLQCQVIYANMPEGPCASEGYYPGLAREVAAKSIPLRKEIFEGQDMICWQQKDDDAVRKIMSEISGFSPSQYSYSIDSQKQMNKVSGALSEAGISYRRGVFNKLVSAGIYSACQRKDTASYRVLSFANEFRKNLSSR